MLRKLLIGTDLSPASEALICCVAEMKAIGLEEVVLTHVLNVAHTPELEETLAREARPHLERQKQLLEGQGLKVTTEMPHGLPARTLLETADRHDVAVIVVGSHGKGLLTSATLGSVSTEVLHMARKPLLLVRNALLEGDQNYRFCSRLFSRILFPTDFSETAEGALSFVGMMGFGLTCPVTLLHVAGKDETLPEVDRRFLLETKKHRLESLGLTQVHIEDAVGDPADEIIERARSGRFSIIVMGRQGKGLVEELFKGSVVRKVAHHVIIPILFIPAIRQS